MSNYCLVMSWVYAIAAVVYAMMAFAPPHQ